MNTCWAVHPAPLGWRLVAALADLLPFGVLLLVGYWHPDAPGGNLLDVTRLVLIGLPTLWWNAALPLMEGAAGRTPGKVLFGLRTVADDGAAISMGQAFLRRVPLFFAFPILAVDAPIGARDEGHRRALDRAAGTLVVADSPERAHWSRFSRGCGVEAHLVTYLFVTATLFMVWEIGSMTRGVRFFWPLFPLAVWAIALAAHAWFALASGGGRRGRAA